MRKLIILIILYNYHMWNYDTFLQLLYTQHNGLSIKYVHKGWNDPTIIQISDRLCTYCLQQKTSGLNFPSTVVGWKPLHRNF